MFLTIVTSELNSYEDFGPSEVMEKCERTLLDYAAGVKRFQCLHVEDDLTPRSTANRMKKRV